jgi:2-methylcitrate dehydratase PrpD
MTELSAGAGNTPVIGVATKLSMRDAMLMNGILIHGLDYDDTHAAGVIHATASTFPCALGSAAQTGLDGEALLTAYVAGMEVGTRLASVAKGGFHQVGFHPTGLIGAFACTLVAGRLFGLNAAQMAMAQGIALSVGSGSMEFLQDGAWTKRMHPGWAGVAGVTAATLARHGFKGPRATYEGRFGVSTATSARSPRNAIWAWRPAAWARSGSSPRSRASRCQPATSRMPAPTRRRSCASATACAWPTSHRCARWCPRKL